MTQREKRLAAAIGCLLGLMVIYFAFSTVMDGITKRNNEITGLQDEISNAEKLKRDGVAAQSRLEEYRRQSLPVDVNVSRLEYEWWLREQIDEVGLGRSIKRIPARQSRSIYQELAYRVTGRGSINQLTDFLYRFYKADELHRIRSLTVKPITGSKLLDIQMLVDALVVQGATKQEIGKQESQRLARDLVAYEDVIVNRNLFSPANRPPELSRIGKQEVTRGDSFSFTAKADDPDKDSLLFELTGDAPEGLEIDAKTGRVRWPAREIEKHQGIQDEGTTEFTIVVRDDGAPAKEATRTVTVAVVEPREEKDDDDRLDKSKFAVIAGIVDDQEGRRMWLNLRTDDETKFLREGDKVAVGSFEGVITYIGLNEVGIRTEDGDMLVNLGENLAEAREAKGG